ncbi:uncharacterized protein Z520_02758 [Fonsecaea multimorphosa CBS 102226]|uniref:Uncharacterized protein n=1 Tax=Fonsecaea multimorphosa CBS 102226 TaxID=1442371 RepID=A0A0D2HGZ2_9EURO|nr:uncharacterized protein Z520_02758 [Fonsecaea multimorphosa CBS 102226]KIY01206.1 hypothetical protein Z520_02758 [Fonsecaea multimorphosa CBS 102226]OAL28817.1 hypothetical protein AYO22_02682 [Fonsecaea multimorphosa]
MTSDFHHSLEPFPLFIDSAPPNSANYFSSPMAMAAIQLLATSSSSSSSHHDSFRKPLVSMPSKLSNYLRLRYYQYEVTFGLYVMTPGEKLVLNSVVLVAFAALSYALFWGFQPFIVNLLCRLIYYVTGSFSTAPQLCS